MNRRPRPQVQIGELHLDVRGVPTQTAAAAASLLHEALHRALVYPGYHDNTSAGQDGPIIASSLISAEALARAIAGRVVHAARHAASNR